MTDLNPSDLNKIHPQQSHPKPSPLPTRKEHAELPHAEGFKKEHSSMDPAGIWSRFLSRGTGSATPEEVKGFLLGLEKMLQITVQQNAKIAKRAAERLRESQE